jgi:hypothetical protein
MTDESEKSHASEPEEEMVLTPGGLRPSSGVAKVEPGQHGTIEDGRLKVVETASGRIVADVGAAGNEPAPTSRRGRAMKAAERPKPAK